MRRICLFLPLLLLACSTPSLQLAQFDGTWLIHSVNGKIVRPSKANLTVQASEQRISGFDGCNRFMGPIRQEQNRYKSMLASTMMACHSELGQLVGQSLGRAFDEGVSVRAVDAQQIILSAPDTVIVLSRH